MALWFSLWDVNIREQALEKLHAVGRSLYKKTPAFSALVYDVKQNDRGSKKQMPIDLIGGLCYTDKKTISFKLKTKCKNRLF